MQGMQSGRNRDYTNATERWEPRCSQGMQSGRNREYANATERRVTLCSQGLRNGRNRDRSTPLREVDRRCGACMTNARYWNRQRVPSLCRRLEFVRESNQGTCAGRLGRNFLGSGISQVLGLLCKRGPESFRKAMPNRHNLMLNTRADIWWWWLWWWVGGGGGTRRTPPPPRTTIANFQVDSDERWRASEHCVSNHAASLRRAHCAPPFGPHSAAKEAASDASPSALAW